MAAAAAAKRWLLQILLKTAAVNLDVRAAFLLSLGACISCHCTCRCVARSTQLRDPAIGIWHPPTPAPFATLVPVLTTCLFWPCPCCSKSGTTDFFIAELTAASFINDAAEIERILYAASYTRKPEYRQVCMAIVWLITTGCVTGCGALDMPAAGVVVCVLCGLCCVVVYALVSVVSCACGKWLAVSEHGHHAVTWVQALNQGNGMVPEGPASNLSVLLQ